MIVIDRVIIKPTVTCDSRANSFHSSLVGPSRDRLKTKLH